MARNEAYERELRNLRRRIKLQETRGYEFDFEQLTEGLNTTELKGLRGKVLLRAATKVKTPSATRLKKTEREKAIDALRKRMERSAEGRPIKYGKTAQQLAYRKSIAQINALRGERLRKLGYYVDKRTGEVLDQRESEIVYAEYEKAKRASQRRQKHYREIGEELGVPKDILQKSILNEPPKPYNYTTPLRAQKAIELYGKTRQQSYIESKNRLYVENLLKGLKLLDDEAWDIVEGAMQHGGFLEPGAKLDIENLDIEKLAVYLAYGQKWGKEIHVVAWAYSSEGVGGTTNFFQFVRFIARDNKYQIITSD